MDTKRTTGRRLSANHTEVLLPAQPIGRPVRRSLRRLAGNHTELVLG